MPLPEAVGIVIGGVLFFTVLTGIGLAVTMAVASAMLKYRSEAARMHLCRFGDVQFLPDRLKWTLDKAALRDFVFRPGIAPWSLLAGMTAVAAILLQWELSLLKDPPSMLVSIAPAVAALSLAGLAAAAGALVFWRGRRFIRSRQEYACREIIGDSAARWEKIAAAAVPKLKELQELSGEIIAVGETAGWRLTTEAPPQHGSGGLSRYLGSDDDTLRLNYLSAAARYFAGHPGQRWRDDTALIRLALDAAQRDLRKGKAAFPDAAACYWEALAAGCEAEIVLKIQGMNMLEEGFKRYTVLMEQLFSQSVRTLLEGVARGEDPEEYRRTVTAIKEETEELVAEAKARRMNKTEAHIVLGLRPDAEAEEINRTCRCLFELWRPADSGDESAVQRTDEVKRAQAFLKEQGRA